MQYDSKIRALKRLLILLGLVFIISACEQNTAKKTESSDLVSEQEETQSEVKVDETISFSKEAQEAISKLKWVDQFNLNSEIDQALETNDLRLFVVAKRGPNVPGIALNEQDSLKKRCGEKYLEGVGDMQFNEAHSLLYNKAIQLASEYNSAIVIRCKALTPQE